MPSKLAARRGGQLPHAKRRGNKEMTSYPTRVRRERRDGGQRTLGGEKNSGGLRDENEQPF